MECDLDFSWFKNKLKAVKEDSRWSQSSIFNHIWAEKKKSENTRRNLQTTKGTFTTTKNSVGEKLNLYIYTELSFTQVLCDTSKHGFPLPLWPPVRTFTVGLFLLVSVEEAVFYGNRRLRSHMCISCCTNIVQCSAWNKPRGEGRQEVPWVAGCCSISIAKICLSHSTGLCASESSKKNKKQKKKTKHFYFNNTSSKVLHGFTHTPIHTVQTQDYGNIDFYKTYVEQMESAHTYSICRPPYLIYSSYLGGV